MDCNGESTELELGAGTERLGRGGFPIALRNCRAQLPAARESSPYTSLVSTVGVASLRVLHVPGTVVPNRVVLATSYYSSGFLSLLLLLSTACTLTDSAPSPAQSRTPACFRVAPPPPTTTT